MRAIYLSVAVMLFLTPATVHASRAELEGRGMPRLLALDYSLVRFLPGSAGSLDPMAAFDYAPSTGSYVLGRYGYETSDRLALALGGRKLRFGYFLDGPTHNLILAGPGGWGFSLGVSDQFLKLESKNYYFDVRDSSEVERYFEREVSERTVRLGFGFQSGNPSGRIYEIGIGGSYLDTDISLTDLRKDPVRRTLSQVSWKSDPGLGFDITARTTAPSGLLLGVRFSYEDMNPTTDFPGDPRMRDRSAWAQAGWRFSDTYLDDLVVGVTGTWTSNAETDATGSSSDLRLDLMETTEYSGGVFISGQHRVWRDLVARAGVQGLGRFVKEEHYRANINNSVLVYRDLQSDSRGQIESPTLFLGVGWTWKSVTLDGQLRESISTDAPFLRWSISVAL